MSEAKHRSCFALLTPRITTIFEKPAPQLNYLMVKYFALLRMPVYNRYRRYRANIFTLPYIGSNAHRREGNYLD